MNPRRAGALGVALWLAGAACGENRTVGSACAGGRCAGDASLDRSCGAEFVLPPATVLPGAEHTRCQLFTLSALDPSGSEDRLYLSQATAHMLPYSHQLDVSITDEIPGVPDGTDVDCASLESDRLTWLPIVASEGGLDAWPFSDAPIAVSKHQRLLVSDRMANHGLTAIEVGVSLKLECVYSTTTVGQVFVFEDRHEYKIAPGQRAMVGPALDGSGQSCRFAHDVKIWSFYHPLEPLLSDYSVDLDGDLLCGWSHGCGVKHMLWRAGFMGGFKLASGHSLGWECVYENRSDMEVTLGGNAPTVCSLSGIYSRVNGGPDDPPEHCGLK
jgi:hypothetical protein